LNSSQVNAKTRGAKRLGGQGREGRWKKLANKKEKDLTARCEKWDESQAKNGRGKKG